MPERPKDPQSEWSIGHIEKSKHPLLEKQRHKLEQAISQNPALQAILQEFQGGAFDEDSFVKTVRNWNYHHSAWVGFYVEKKFHGSRDHVLVVKMDRAGNIQLSLNEI